MQGKELWSVIGARMGFVSFPASENEPATSGPGVAQRLAQVYKEYVAGFDQVYINSVAESRRKMLANNNPQTAPTVGSGNPTQPQPIRGALSPQHMQIMVAYANKPVAELRALNLGDKMISFIEANRPYLQRALVEQGMFRGNLQNPGGLRQGDQPGGGGSGGGGMGNPMNPFQQGPSAQPNALAGFHPQFLAHNRGGPVALGRPQPPPQGHSLLPNGNGPNPLRLGTTPQQIEMARAFITKTKQDFIQNSQFPVVLNPCL